MATAGFPWTFAPWVLLCLLLSLAPYPFGIARLWHRIGIGRGIRFGEAAAFAGGREI